MTSLIGPTLYHAYIWENRQMTDLNSRVPHGSNRLLTSATAINENGDIVGVGLLNGWSHGFLLPSGETPPPPPTSHVFPKGRYTVVPTVTDGRGATATTEISIRVR